MLPCQTAPRLEGAEIELRIGSLAERPLVPVDASNVRRGVAILRRRFRIPYTDAAMNAAAERLRPATFYTEDLNDGQADGSLTVRNPLPDAPLFPHQRVNAKVVKSCRKRIGKRIGAQILRAGRAGSLEALEIVDHAETARNIERGVT